jgi:putative tryptophan/tyrosine transport system substrate-binding protein
MSSLPRKQDHPKEQAGNYRPKDWRNFMTKIAFRFTLSAMLLALSVSAEAQQPRKVPRVGFLIGGSASATSGRTEAFRKGLRELGYVDGKNIAIEWRSAEGKLDHLPALAAELVLK